MFASGLARVRARAERRVPDRSSSRPGRRRGADQPRDALDHLRHISAAGARGTRSGSGPASRRRALAIGPLVGGLLTEHVGWSSIFYINVPIGAVAIVASLLLIESRGTRRRSAAGPAGLFTSGLGLFALTYGLIEGNWPRLDVGADPRSIRARGCRASPLRRARARDSGHRCSTSPVPEPNVLRREPRHPAGALAMFGVFFFVSLYMQNVLGYSPVKAGAAFLPMTLLIMVMAPLTGRLSDRVGSRWLHHRRDDARRDAALLPLAARSRRELPGLVPGMLLGGFGMASVMHRRARPPSAAFRSTRPEWARPSSTPLDSSEARSGSR